MTKKLLLVGLLVFCVTYIHLGPGPFMPSAHAKTLVFGGVQMSIPGADTHELGAGGVFTVGQEITERLIVVGNYNAPKTGEGLSLDNGLAGILLLTDNFFGFGGLYLNLEGGIGKIENQKVQFASLIGGGCYFDVSEEATLWLGAGQSNTGKMTVFSIQAELSLGIDWK